MIRGTNRSIEKDPRSERGSGTLTGAVANRWNRSGNENPICHPIGIVCGISRNRDDVAFQAEVPEVLLDPLGFWIRGPPSDRRTGLRVRCPNAIAHSRWTCVATDFRWQKRPSGVYVLMCSRGFSADHVLPEDEGLHRAPQPRRLVSDPMTKSGEELKMSRRSV